MNMLPPLENEPAVHFSRSGARAVNGETIVSDDVAARSRKNATIVLHKLGMVGLRPVADALGVAESTVSRMKDGDIDRLGKMLAVLGLKVVSAELELMDMRQVEAMLTLTKAHINGIDSAAQLVLDET